ncbi:Phage_integrase domain-containing protein [Vibrio jasicida]|uniref:site-specific integrase n=1 Tax=Vibrio jasicida TaxID=766224 RepID=UPI0028958BFA|nr:Phage_integrase domain-containing protein [Vibrio jasicida]
MRYLTLNNSGIWSFRFQIPKKYRPIFDNRYEVKKCLNTPCKQQAYLFALELELQIRKKIADANPTLAGNANPTLAGNANPTLAGNANPTLIEKLPPLNITPKQRKRINTKCPLRCLEEYKEYKSSYVSEKTIEGAYAKCLLVLNLISKSNISSIRRNEAERARKLLLALPSNIKKHRQFEGLTPIKAIELNQNLMLPVISGSSVKDYIQKCSSFFEWCVQMEYTDVNPFKGFRFKNDQKASKAKNAYSNDDLRLVFSDKVFVEKHYKHNYQYWLPLLARLTGARINEICQLYREDITVIDGITCISINRNTSDKRLKTPNSERTIPLHPKLIRLGFLKYVESVGAQRLFPELRLERDGYATSASKWYGRFKSRLGLPKGYDFHSFRHTFANQLKNALVPSVIASELLGHSQQSMSYDRYGKELNNQLKLTAIEKLDTSDLDHLLN